jgi:hypothetical protein
MSDAPKDAVERTQLLYCPFCEKPVIAIELARAEWLGPDRDPPLEYYIFLRCTSCYKPLLVMQELWDTEGGDPEEPVRLWPSPPRLSYEIPQSLRREVTEARSCFDTKAYTATVVMVRRTLEGVCADHGVTKRPLNNALKEMGSLNLLDGDLLTWADELRVLGNEGAHYTGLPVSREDAKDALSLAEAVLDYIYVLRKQFKEFQKRRSR